MAEVQATKFDEAGEQVVAWRLVGLVLLTLTVVKPLGGIAIIGTAAFTIAALLQLWLPIRRADAIGAPLKIIGLHWDNWRTDAKWVGWLVLLTFPPYVALHHLYMTTGHDWLVALDLRDLAAWVPRRQFAPEPPADLWATVVAAGWFLQMSATHVIGVALPEETFYRGYLQPRLEHRWPPVRKVLGVPFGKGAIIACALFAAGHFLGEWNPMRLGPFIPGLVFAWLRNASGSVIGAIGYHGLCNILGEFLFTLYQAR